MIKIETHYTIGLAGHIDHGKTSLTKALTNMETDRLKEEQERNISIELGYAYFQLTDGSVISVIDVPGHERFIRQMIAGVAGIDLVLLVVAADEAVMPQTREHIEILSLLGIERGIIVVTKIDKVDEELLALVEEDIRSECTGTFLESAPICNVDSVSLKGIDVLKQLINNELHFVTHRNSMGPFRLPIDQVFSVQGQGTVVRGTVYEGRIREGEFLEILPSELKTRARQIQVHHQPVQEAAAGQRAAINIGGLSKDEVKRGDVLVSSQHYTVTTMIDVSLQVVKKLDYPVKQRGYIKVHIGTAEVYGKIIMFDRNKLEEKEEVLCQLQLEEPVVTKRGDHFILRRPTPMETIGGGIVINANGQKYRFGDKTVEMLKRKQAGEPKDIIIEVVKTQQSVTHEQLLIQSAIDEEELTVMMDQLLETNKIIEWEKGQFTLQTLYESTLLQMKEDLRQFHETNSMQIGKKKAEITQSFGTIIQLKLLEYFIQLAVEKGEITREGPYLALKEFTPSIPKTWEKRINFICSGLKEEGVNVSPLSDWFTRQQIPSDLQEEIRHFLLRNEQLYALDEKHFIHADVLKETVTHLQNGTSQEFSLKDAKEVLNVSRKYLVPLLELLDRIGYTTRQEQNRVWK
ncbi:selenocysteine-specific translation elongation factor [Alkalihalobacterium chitinilyticum]|uniref:Selenocysteine-specific elongation factor n=1 Tax=Alkalihalobacterium chitinilyticum TaxID=2980103 RepID=A0ABT5VF50_9BACI|nr:selenocysteine-specific translation elongation factor [Alkalihalobacterium chitinilyticum]MDE5412844.1 selenocysteine-specific translation elongation factor [Alkalihalobacterium chitinilyticum]